MKRYSVLIALLLVMSFGLAQSKINDGMYRYNLSFTLSKTNFVDTIPIVFSDDQVYIPVMIDGQKRMFNLDTGSSGGVVYEGGNIAYGERLGDVQSRDANNRIDTIPAVRMPSFVLGSIVINGYSANVLSRPEGRYAYDGILGFDLFNKGLYAKIDARAGYIVLTDRPHFFDREPGYKLKYKLRRFTPYIYINTFLDHEEPTLFDLGAQELYVINKASFDKCRHEDARVVSMIEETSEGQSAIGNYGAEKEGLLFYILFKRLGWDDDFALCNVRGTTTQGDSRMGAQLLRYGSVVINPKKRTLSFRPFNGKDTVEVNNRLDPITYVPVDGRAVVGTIRHTSRQYKIGFRQGDVILKINNDEIPDFQTFRNYHFVKGERYVFVLRSRRGFNKEVTVEQWGQ